MGRRRRRERGGARSAVQCSSPHRAPHTRQSDGMGRPEKREEDGVSDQDTIQCPDQRGVLISE